MLPAVTEIRMWTLVWVNYPLFSWIWKHWRLKVIFCRHCYNTNVVCFNSHLVSSTHLPPSSLHVLSSVIHLSHTNFLTSNFGWACGQNDVILWIYLLYSCALCIMVSLVECQWLVGLRHQLSHASSGTFYHWVHATSRALPLVVACYHWGHTIRPSVCVFVLVSVSVEVAVVCSRRVSLAAASRWKHSSEEVGQHEGWGLCWQVPCTAIIVLSTCVSSTISHSTRRLRTLLTGSMHCYQCLEYVC